MCLVDDELWISKTLGGARIFRIDVSTLTPTLVLSETIFETWKGSGVTNFSIGVLEYIASIDETWVALSYNEGFGTEPWLLRIDSSGTIIGLAAFLPPSHLYYVAEFDRVVFGTSPPGAGLAWLDPSDNSIGTISATDAMTATKGCFCTSLNKVALPVLTGDPGSRRFTVNFYSAADLGA
jgi:hypothetical protein